MVVKNKEENMNEETKEDWDLLTISLRPEHKAWIEEMARKEERSVSAFCRTRILKELREQATQKKSAQDSIKCIREHIS